MNQEPTKGVSAPEATDNRKLSVREQRIVRRNSVKARRRRKQLLCLLLTLILLLLAAIPGYKLLYQPYQAKTTYQAMKNLYGQPGKGRLPAGYNEQLGALYDINTDIGGWLVVPGTDINLPVATTVNHDSVYYVNHLFDGKTNPFGTPYYLSDCRPMEAHYNMVIRGSQQLMGEIGEYRTLSFYQQAPLLFLDTLEGASIYKIFAIVDVAENEVSQFANGTFSSAARFHNFVTQMEQRSILATGITVQENDRLLTLLCDTQDGKLAVIGRAVREDEDYTVDTSAASVRQIGTNQQMADWWVTPVEVSHADASAGVTVPDGSSSVVSRDSSGAVS